MPWEILRVDLPLIGGEGPTRPVDIYTNQGALPPYCAILALSPDHGFAFVALTRGPGLLPITELAVSTWVTAVEAAARADATEKLAGTYQLREPAPADVDREANAEKNTYITLATKNDRTGLVITNLFVNGVDILNTAMFLSLSTSNLPGRLLEVFSLYPSRSSIPDAPSHSFSFHSLPVHLPYALLVDPSSLRPFLRPTFVHCVYNYVQVFIDDPAKEKH
jgi:hypothetical protein